METRALLSRLGVRVGPLCSQALVLGEGIIYQWLNASATWHLTLVTFYARAWPCFSPCWVVIIPVSMCVG